MNYPLVIWACILEKEATNCSDILSKTAADNSHFIRRIVELAFKYKRDGVSSLAYDLRVFHSFRTMRVALCLDLFQAFD